MLVKTRKILAIIIPLLLLEIGVFQFNNNVATAQQRSQQSTSSSARQCRTYYQRYRCGNQICVYPLRSCR
jgi:hypothetical protein